MEEIDNQQVTPEELGWLAGAFDADGHMNMRIYKYKGRKNCSINFGFTNTNRDFLCKVLFICEKLGVRLHIQEKTRAKKYWSPAWVVKTGKMTLIAKMLKPLIPMLTVKKERAEILLAFCERRLGIAKDRCGGNVQSASRKYPYNENDLWFFEKFLELNKRVTSTTIPNGSRTQGSSKRREQVNRLTC